MPDDNQLATTIAYKLCLKSPDHGQVYDRLKARAGNLWSEVCYAANLKENMNPTQFATAIIHGLSEWDLVPERT